MNPNYGAPPPPPVAAINLSFCQPGPLTLVMKEKLWSWTGDSFQIKDTNGNVYFQIAGQVMSFRDKKKLLDYAGNPLGTLKSPLFSIRTRYNVTSPSGQTLVSILKRFTFFKSKLTAKFTNLADGSQCKVVVKGDWRDKRATITLDGRLLATVNRALNMEHIFFGKETYQIFIEPGVDMALIVFLVLAFDEAENDRNE
jgi:uncharacterized protein YxjI